MANKTSKKKQRYRNKTIAYLRVSTNKQDLNNQRLELHEYARKNNLKIDKFIEVEVSSRKSIKKRKIDELLENLRSGDLLLVPDLSRLGRSVGQIIQIVDSLVHKKIKFISIKESIRLDGKQDIQTKTMITLFGLFAELERDLISLRTKHGLSVAREKGKILGRPKGKGKSKLDQYQVEIESLIQNGATKVHIANKYDTSLPNLYNWLQRNKIPHLKKNIQKIMKVTLWLRVENNNKFVRGKKKVREEIERFCLQSYDMKKLEDDGWEYQLSIPYKDKEELDKTVHGLLGEMQSMADMKNCFIEADIREIGGNQSW